MHRSPAPRTGHVACAGCWRALSKQRLRCQKGPSVWSLSTKQCCHRCEAKPGWIILRLCPQQPKLAPAKALRRRSPSPPLAARSQQPPPPKNQHPTKKTDQAQPAGLDAAGRQLVDDRPHAAQPARLQADVCDGRAPLGAGDHRGLGVRPAPLFDARARRQHRNFFLFFLLS